MCVLQQAVTSSRSPIGSLLNWIKKFILKSKSFGKYEGTVVNETNRDYAYAYGEDKECIKYSNQEGRSDSVCLYIYIYISEKIILKWTLYKSYVRMWTGSWHRPMTIIVNMIVVHRFRVVMENFLVSQRNISFSSTTGFQRLIFYVGFSNFIVNFSLLVNPNHAWF